ncbi:5'-nucleotidase [Clostridium pasteurianum DSM 525 = ATCC 6013]|uniref:5'-nucleotidase n=1 Tax=Clostridium pasteurianum DSM 525 = ATCC 6013 TaxID=1262449 RepID=A0A0H3J2V4_CLOPA|nr:HAD family hydrolase [Clostridium pasteurianum]AJA48256.1 5'-nucleotidase [Clostridium pasteurianum DSM 525 = ATCC 6013]AJA52244.1 5'-nucleotidase [Clostridium pasteurianum DSM 525 = ATCC 6013]AOZ75511.1 phosphoglycolate phosphatase [Clostridium pasteurianum DSM 525 = ATCC 6013]AOZ79306.1 phosphoglycolate phosphatase [Clostridium pasteurianum]ELP60594.1 phosphatase [Clostridium pasteurianum DSM 525 = ATCC 6013]
MKKNYNTILFDLDGTLTNPKVGITKSIQYALKYFGIFESDLENLNKFIGPPLKDSFKKYYNFSDVDANNAVEKYREYFSDKGIFENKLYNGIVELLNKLYNKDKNLIIATSKPKIFAERILTYFNIDKYFTFVAGSNLDGTLSRKGEVISHALEVCKCEKDNVIMVGDRKYDIIGAKEIKIHSIGVLYGYGSYEELKKEQPEYIVKDINGLSQILD